MNVSKFYITYLYLIICLIVIGCGQNNSEKIQNLENQISSLKEEKERLTKQISDCQRQLEDYSSRISNTSKSIDLPSVNNNRMSEWEFVESTKLQTSDGDNTISGTIEEGFVFRTLSGNFYRAKPLTLQVVVTVMPDVEIYRNGNEFKLIIDDFDEPVFCDKVERR